MVVTVAVVACCAEGTAAMLLVEEPTGGAVRPG